MRALATIVIVFTLTSYLGFQLQQKKSESRIPAQISSQNTQVPQLIANAPIALTSECQKFIRSIRNNFDYGWIKNSEDPERPELPPIFVFYYTNKKHSSSYKNTPTVFFNGGPMSASHGEHLILSKPPYPLWAVYLDQRGTGCSTPYPSNRPYKDYTHWGSADIVRDAEMIRQKLGYKKWNIFGQSFGGAIVQRYLQDSPQSVLRAVAHGGGGAISDPTFYMQNRLDLQIRTVEKYLTTYPEDQAKVVAIIKNRLCTPLNHYCGADAIKALIASIGILSSWEQIHSGIDFIYTQNKSLALDEYLTKQSKDKSKNNDLSTEITKKITISDYGMMDFVDCNIIRQKYLQKFSDSEIFVFSECWQTPLQQGLSRVQAQQVFQSQNITRLDPAKIKSHLQSYNEIEYYLFSAQYDYYSPPLVLKKMSEEIGPKVKYTEISESGHESYSNMIVLRPLIPQIDTFFKEQGY